MCTQALSVKDYYDHIDFKDNYISFLGEDSHQCIKQIQNIIYDNCETFNLPFYTRPTKEQAETILNWFIENAQEYRDFNSNYVGYYCIDSVSFGEQYNEIQEEEGKTLEELQSEFDQEGFYVDGIAVYYNLSSSGVYWDLRDMPEDELMRVFR